MLSTQKEWPMITIQSSPHQNSSQGSGSLESNLWLPFSSRFSKHVTSKLYWAEEKKKMHTEITILKQAYLSKNILNRNISSDSKAKEKWRTHFPCSFNAVYVQASSLAHSQTAGIWPILRTVSRFLLCFPLPGVSGPSWLPFLTKLKKGRRAWCGGAHM